MIDLTTIQVTEDTKLEAAIIGAIIMDKSLYDIAFSNLIPDDFLIHENRIIFNSFLRLYTSGTPIDMVTLNRDLANNNDPNCMDQILYCCGTIGSTANFEHHVLILKDMAAKRQLCQLGWGISHESTQEGKRANDIINVALDSIKSLQSRIVPNKIKTFQEKYIEVIDKALNKDGQDSLGLLTCYNKLNKLTLGYTAPDYTIIAAGPGEGKSTFALNQAVSISLKGNDVLYFSLEMSEEQFIWKMLSSEFNMSVSDVRLGRFNPEEAQKARIATAKLHIYDKGGLTIDDFAGIVKMEHKAKDIKIVFIDYIQLMRVGSYSRKVSNKNDEVTIISNKIKQLAMELNIPIVVLSQLNRDKHRKQYSLSDLRDSGTLEQDADNVIFIFRPEVHNMNIYEMANNQIQVNSDTTIITIAKQRLGVTGEFEMVFKGEYSRFEDTDENKEKEYKPMAAIKPNKDDIPF
jgi:replicative DNA helicase